MRECAVGWQDQIEAVLVGARQPLSTNEVGERARVVPTGPYAQKTPLVQRQGGDPGQECYRVLAKLARRGMVVKSYKSYDRRVFWSASGALRQRFVESLGLMPPTEPLPRPE